MSQQHTDGLLLVVPIGREEYLDRLHELHLPYVLVDVDGADAAKSPSVGTTNRQGAYDATCHLLELQHRRIGFITDAPNISSGIERLKGYREALESYDIPYDPDLIQVDNFVKPYPRTAVDKLLALTRPPTAILTSSDPIAFRLQELLREANLEIPNDISIVGFDDIPHASLVHPKLTTVHQPLYEMGATAAHMLLERIQNPGLPYQRIQLQTHLVIRNSTAPCRDTN